MKASGIAGWNLAPTLPGPRSWADILVCLPMVGQTFLSAASPGAGAFLPPERTRMGSGHKNVPTHPFDGRQECLPPRCHRQKRTLDSRDHHPLVIRWQTRMSAPPILCRHTPIGEATARRYAWVFGKSRGFDPIMPVSY